MSYYGCGPFRHLFASRCVTESGSGMPADCIDVFDEDCARGFGNGSEEPTSNYEYWGCGYGGVDYGLGFGEYGQHEWEASP
jgi:hypothetical protein